MCHTLLFGWVAWEPFEGVEKGYVGTSSLGCDAGNTEAKFNVNKAAHLPVNS